MATSVQHVSSPLPESWKSYMKVRKSRRDCWRPSISTAPSPSQHSCYSPHTPDSYKGRRLSSSASFTGQTELERLSPFGRSHFNTWLGGAGSVNRSSPASIRISRNYMPIRTRLSTRYSPVRRHLDTTALHLTSRYTPTRCQSYSHTNETDDVELNVKSEGGEVGARKVAVKKTHPGNADDAEVLCDEDTNCSKYCPTPNGWMDKRCQFENENKWGLLSCMYPYEGPPLQRPWSSCTQTRASTWEEKARPYCWDPPEHFPEKARYTKGRYCDDIDWKCRRELSAPCSGFPRWSSIASHDNSSFQQPTSRNRACVGRSVSPVINRICSSGRYRGVSASSADGSRSPYKRYGMRCWTGCADDPVDQELGETQSNTAVGKKKCVTKGDLKGWRRQACATKRSVKRSPSRRKGKQPQKGGAIRKPGIQDTKSPNKAGKACYFSRSHMSTNRKNHKPTLQPYIPTDDGIALTRPSNSVDILSFDQWAKKYFPPKSLSAMMNDRKVGDEEVNNEKLDGDDDSVLDKGLNIGEHNNIENMNISYNSNDVSEYSLFSRTNHIITPDCYIKNTRVFREMLIDGLPPKHPQSDPGTNNTPHQKSKINRLPPKITYSAFCPKQHTKLTTPSERINSSQVANHAIPRPKSAGSAFINREPKSPLSSEKTKARASVKTTIPATNKPNGSKKKRKPCRQSHKPRTIKVSNCALSERVGDSDAKTTGVSKMNCQTLGSDVFNLSPWDAQDEDRKPVTKTSKRKIIKARKSNSSSSNNIKTQVPESVRKVRCSSSTDCRRHRSMKGIIKGRKEDHQVPSVREHLSIERMDPKTCKLEADRYKLREMLNQERHTYAVSQSDSKILFPSKNVKETPRYTLETESKPTDPNSRGDLNKPNCTLGGKSKPEVSFEKCHKNTTVVYPRKMNTIQFDSEDKRTGPRRQQSQASHGELSITPTDECHWVGQAGGTSKHGLEKIKSTEQTSDSKLSHPNTEFHSICKKYPLLTFRPKSILKPWVQPLNADRTAASIKIIEGKEGSPERLVREEDQKKRPLIEKDHIGLKNNKKDTFTDKISELDVQFSYKKVPYPEDTGLKCNWTSHKKEEKINTDLQMNSTEISPSLSAGDKKQKNELKPKKKRSKKKVRHLFQSQGAHPSTGSRSLKSEAKTYHQLGLAPLVRSPSSENTFVFAKILGLSPTTSEPKCLGTKTKKKRRKRKKGRPSLTTGRI